MWQYIKDNIWPLLLAINYGLVIIFSVHILLKNKNPVKTISYLFALAVFPFLGLLVYYFFGQDYRKSKIFEKKYFLDNDKIRKWSDSFNLDDEEKEDFEEDFGDGVFKIYKLLKNNQRAVLTFDNEVEILINGEMKFKRLLEDLEKAQNHIHLEYFVLFDDEVGNLVIDRLCAKAKSGVQVRLIYDDVGSRISRKTKKKLRDSGVRYYPFMPVFFSNSTSKVNYRDHRKIVVIDGNIGYVGGINLDKKYDNSLKNKRFWRDTHLRIEGSAAGSLQAAFLLSWNFVSKQEVEIEEVWFPRSEPKTKAPTAVQIAASGPDTDWANIMEAFFCAITSARKCIYISSPYFMPNAQILTALTTASRSGVDVRIIIPKVSDSWPAQYATDSYIEELEHSGVQMYRYKKGFVHAKTLVIDDVFSSIGTANMDYRSFALNFEINALIYDKEVNRQMKRIFEKDLEECEEIEYERWVERSIVRKLQESFARLLAPLL
ncbi:cardiolipin synthase [Maribacter algicola]|uniref:Cardiolipin synthase n=1 Tax=Meishania litoralis TaxID=3434685 RepID=A0ACC7LNG3_9FLAO